MTSWLKTDLTLCHPFHGPMPEIHSAVIRVIYPSGAPSGTNVVSAWIQDLGQSVYQFWGTTLGNSGTTINHKIII